METTQSPFAPSPREGEPVFTLCGRDPTAGILIRLWVSLREALDDGEPAQLEEALRCAAACENYAIENGKRDKVVEAVEALHKMAVGR